MQSRPSRNVARSKKSTRKTWELNIFEQTVWARKRRHLAPGNEISAGLNGQISRRSGDLESETAVGKQVNQAHPNRNVGRRYTGPVGSDAQFVPLHGCGKRIRARRDILPKVKPVNRGA